MGQERQVRFCLLGFDLGVFNGPAYFIAHGFEVLRELLGGVASWIEHQFIEFIFEFGAFDGLDPFEVQVLKHILRSVSM